MGAGAVIKSAVKSNADGAGGIGGLFSMFKVGGEGIGFKKGWNGLTQGHADMRNAGKVLKNDGSEKKKLQEAITRETAKESPDGLALSKMQKKLDNWDNVRAGHELTHREGLSGMGQGAKDMALSPFRYLGAADRRHQDGRFMTALARSGTAAGAYMGLAAGTRYMGGGSFTQNSNGEQDIAGIPFI